MAVSGEPPEGSDAQLRVASDSCQAASALTGSHQLRQRVGVHLAHHLAPVGVHGRVVPKPAQVGKQVNVDGETGFATPISAQSQAKMRSVCCVSPRGPAILTPVHNRRHQPVLQSALPERARSPRPALIPRSRGMVAGVPLLVAYMGLGQGETQPYPPTHAPPSTTHVVPAAQDSHVAVSVTVVRSPQKGSVGSART